jgi:hypothetical protein
MMLGKNSYRRLPRRLRRLNPPNPLLSDASGVEVLGVEACAGDIFAIFAKE